jgi:glutamine amidotransferase
MTVVDMGMGNIGSVVRALKFLGIAHAVCVDPDAVPRASAVILPGVGSFGEASRRLAESGMGEAIVDSVRARQTPVLGICLGMQLLATSGDEGGEGAPSPGLGLIAGHVAALRRSELSLRIPHMGWNDVQCGSMAMFAGIPDGACFYFVHSYAMQLHEDIPHATTDYGGRIVAAVASGVVWGAQFHPEKSQDAGLQVLRNFAALAC